MEKVGIKKYPSIENTYQEKHIAKWLEWYPELKDCMYVTQEKLHGANFQFLIERTSPILRPRFFSREQELFPESKFYNFYPVASKALDNFRFPKGYKEIRFYGELIGPKIQKGVKYGSEKEFRLFDVWVDGVWAPPCELHMFVEDVSMLVPFADSFGNLEDALNCNTKFNSLLYPQEDNICEGVVIKPWRKVYTNKEGSVFYLKKKNEEFLEKERAPKPPKDPTAADPLNELFRTYITDNRVQSVFSKHGPIQENKEISKYIKLILEDAKSDFMKDHGVEVVALNDPKLQKDVYNVGSDIAKLLMGYL